VAASLMRGLVVVAAAIVASASPVARSATVPRPSPELSIKQPQGQTSYLSSLKGKVVVLEFLFVKSEHCLRVARTLNSLYGELGARGFQPVAIAFDPPNSPPTGETLITAMKAYLKLAFPVGYASKGEVDAYLSRGRDETLNIPQIVVIDRSGTIRATSGGRGGAPALEDSGTLRSLVEALLSESASGSARK
jgi:peroxiredoxin